MKKSFSDRSEAGRALAQQLAKLDLREPVVLALPRGGVPVAAEIARELKAPLDLVLVRKIGVPWQPELAVAAIVDGEHPEMVIDTDVQRAAGVDRAYIEAEAKKQLREIERRRRAYLGGRSPIPLEGRTVIVVDDGIATGTTVRAALQALRRHKPAALVLAVPVAPRETIAELRREVDRIVCLAEPEPFYAIGLHYGDFHQVEDEEVTAALSSVSGTSQSVGQDAGKPQQS
ncbi:Phosphoribosyl transferase domain protein [Burkholderiales bacterium]|jgi:putative phosphoribosyl transferase|nr:Phosphoribosyl transferase domain protein [Burkholderiales bacterium]